MYEMRKHQEDIPMSELLQMIQYVGIVPIGTAAFFVARYFWKKEKCFIEHKAAINTLKRSDEASKKIHSEMNKKIGNIERNLMLIMGQLKIKPV